MVGTVMLPMALLSKHGRELQLQMHLKNKVVHEQSRRYKSGDWDLHLGIPYVLGGRGVLGELDSRTGALAPMCWGSSSAARPEGTPYYTQ
jgi:hypothetical protein